jgi:hypothetical protein
MFRIGVEKAPNHSLILRIVSPCLVLEEFNAALAQRDGDLDPLVSEDEVLRRRKEVTNDLQSSEGLIRVFDFGAHKLNCLPSSPVARTKGSDDVVAVREADREHSALTQPKQ